MIHQIDYKYSLIKEKGNYAAICSLLASSNYPVGIFRSPDELSVLCPSDFDLSIFSDKEEAGWICFYIVGDMPFGTVQGLISQISSALYKQKIGICVVSTFKSDWFFIRTKYKDLAIATLTSIGWEIE